MKLICGLGNPGDQYRFTRHNVGFLALDWLSRKENFEFKKQKKFCALTFKGKALGHELFFLKPQTFMNLSGESILPALTFFKLSPVDLIVIHDDVDLPFQTVRLKTLGGTAGHKGLESLVSKIGNDFLRIRIGVGRPQPIIMDTSDWVLKNFSKKEIELLPEILDRGVFGLELILTHGIDEAMNKFN